uniref:ANK_REP_REGION domain-containing protein n=1 Tax=Macrostomum lignano TaxID=282301 RepID=A0A1I8GG44_9PLAT
MKGHTDVIKTLLDAGASASLVNNAGDTPLALAADPHWETATSLLKVQDLGSSIQSPEACLVKACQLGHWETALIIMRGNHSSLNKSNLLDMPSQCVALLEDCIDLVKQQTVLQKKKLKRHDTLSHEEDLSQMLFCCLRDSGFTQEGAAVQQAAADILQQIARKSGMGSVNAVGSFSEGWGSSLKALDGRIDSDSDIDFTVILVVELHLQQYCKCVAPDLNRMAAYEKGYVQYPVGSMYELVY